MMHSALSTALAIPASALARHICLIFGNSSKAQVIGPYANSIVALMHDAKACGDWPIGYLPRNAMGPLNLSFSSSNFNFPISIVPRSPFPLPTGIAFSDVYTAPKPFFKGIHGGLIA